MGLAAGAVGGGLAIGSGIAGHRAATAQRRSIRDAMQHRRQAQTIQQRQLAAQAAQAREQRVSEGHQVRGRLRVAAGEAGTGMGGSFAAMMRQADFDEFRGLDAIDRNLAMQLDAVRSGAQADLTQLRAQAPNPILSAFMGGVQGLSTGLSIVGAAQSLDQTR